jgi:glycosyltransferase involved in cell wall biosynthesis
MPLEVLVCDDGSPAAVADEVRAWCASQPAVEFIGLTPNRGTPAPARNAGLRRAHGEWIAFLDDDDRWLPGKLATQWGPRAKREVGRHRGRRVRTDRTAFYTDAMRPPYEPTHADVLAANPVILSTALARRSVLLAAGGFPEQRHLAGIEDYGLGWRRPTGEPGSSCSGTRSFSTRTPRPSG